MLDGKLLFTHATKDQLKRLDFEKLLEKRGTSLQEQQEAEEKAKKEGLSPLEFILKEFLSIKHFAILKALIKWNFREKPAPEKSL